MKLGLHLYDFSWSEDARQLGPTLVRIAQAAELQGDTAFLEKFLADDFVGVGPLGFLLSKQEWLARHQSGDMKYTAHTLASSRARAYTEAAIVIGRLTQEASYRGNPMNVQMRTTLVFVRQDGQWQLAGLHLCNIGQPPPFTRSKAAPIGSSKNI